MAHAAIADRAHVRLAAGFYVGITGLLDGLVRLLHRALLLRIATRGARRTGTGWASAGRPCARRRAAGRSCAAGRCRRCRGLLRRWGIALLRATLLRRSL